jgi:hypothetical protein
VKPASDTGARADGFRRLAATTVVLAPAWLPRLALACPVCFSQANQDVLRTYYFTTALLTLLPLVIIAVIGTWMYRRSVALAADEAAPAIMTPADPVNASGRRGI